MPGSGDIVNAFDLEQRFGGQPPGTGHARSEDQAQARGMFNVLKFVIFHNAFLRPGYGSY